MKRQILYLLTSFFFFASFTIPNKLLGAPYYEGKVMSIIVGSDPGGGYDRMARLLAKHLPRFIPGKPTIIVQNMTGAGSIVCANYLYNQAKPDGLTIGTFNRGLVFDQLCKMEGVRFDLTKFSWIGSPCIEPTLLCIRSDLPYKTINDLLAVKDPIVVGDPGATTVGAQFCALLIRYAGLKLKMISYPGTSQIMIAVERKELQGCEGAYSTVLPFMSRGLIIPVVRGHASVPAIESLPVDEDLTTDNMGKTLMRMFSTADQVGRPFVAPPRTPVDVMKILKDAFAKAAKDPELQEESKKIMMMVQYVTAEESLEVTNLILNEPKPVVEEFLKYIIK